MNRNKLVVLVGALCAIVFAFSMVSNAMAAEDFKRWGFGVHGLYIDPDEDSDVAGLSVEPAITPGITLEYFVTKNIGVELVAAVAKHDIEINGKNVGSLWILPPSLYAKYHFMVDSKISPYVGAGVNWVYAWDEKLTLNGVDGVDLDIDDSFGWAVKVGADIALAENLFVNVDVMYLDVDTDMEIAGGAIKSDLEINPWVYSAGLRYRF